MVCHLEGTPNFELYEEKKSWRYDQNKIYTKWTTSVQALQLQLSGQVDIHIIKTIYLESRMSIIKKCEDVTKKT